MIHSEFLERKGKEMFQNLMPNEVEVSDQILT